MTRDVIIALALAAALGGCATAWTEDDSTQPSAAITEALRPLAGHWQGTLWETATIYYQGQAALDIDLGDDGGWHGTIGRATATGTARMRHGWLVLSGTATSPDGKQEAVYYELKGDANRRWGEVTATFAGRIEHASVSLRRTP
jgi:hypothetical protein